MAETTSDKPITQDKLGILNILVLVLSLYVLVALIADTFFQLPAETVKLLEIIDNAVCIFFIVEFFIRFHRAENKLQFMKWGWIDLVSSVQTFKFMRAGRLIRLVRILRILRAFRSTKHIVSHIYKNKAKGAFATVGMIAALMVVFSSIAILQVETSPESNIKTAEDALWWAYVTITTVCYGDKYPVTTEGRLIAAALMTGRCWTFGHVCGLYYHVHRLSYELTLLG